MWWDYIKAVLLIVVIIAAAYYVTRLVVIKGTGNTKNANIRLLGSRALGRDRHIVLTEVGDKVYILGVTGQSIHLIDSLPGEAYHAREAEQSAATPPARESGFAKEFLERFKGTYKGP